MKPGKCKSCGSCFERVRAMQVACSPLCALDIARAKRERAETKQRQAERKKDRQKREENKTIPVLKKETTNAFNRYIRLRDRGRDCICCGKPLVYGVGGGAVDAGHYRSTGSADHLRYVEDNCHAQRADCNRYGAGRAVDYRIGLIARIGIERVEALEANNTPIKWTREILQEIKATYRAKARELEKEMA